VGLDDLSYDELLMRAGPLLDEFTQPEVADLTDGQLRSRARPLLDEFAVAEAPTLSYDELLVGAGPILDEFAVAERVPDEELHARAAQVLAGFPVALPELAPELSEYDQLLGRADPHLRFNPNHGAHGRFAPGDGPDRSVGGEGMAGHVPGGGVVSAAQAREALLTSVDARVSVAPDQVDELMTSMAGGTPVNLEHLQVTGKGNENLYMVHATETPRADMPQLPETVEGMGEFRAALAAAGVSTRVGFADPRSLHATQNELDGAKVGKLYGFIKNGGYKADSTLIVSREGAILDGHHRWAAASAARATGSSFKVKVLRVDMPISKLLPFSQPFSGARRGMADAAATEIKAATRSHAEALMGWLAGARLRYNPNHGEKGRFTTGDGGEHTSGGSDGELTDLFRRAEDGGFTYSPATHEYAEKGYAVSPYPERTRVIQTKDFTPHDIARYREDNKDLLAKPDHKMGAWREKDGDKDQIWMDVSIVSGSRSAAAAVGRKFNQVAMYDLAKGETIDLGGTGEARSRMLGADAPPWLRGLPPLIRGP
jgi:hypothetical protein